MAGNGTPQSYLNGIIQRNNNGQIRDRAMEQDNSNSGNPYGYLPQLPGQQVPSSYPSNRYIPPMWDPNGGGPYGSWSTQGLTYSLPTAYTPYGQGGLPFGPTSYGQQDLADALSWMGNGPVASGISSIFGNPGNGTSGGVMTGSGAGNTRPIPGSPVNNPLGNAPGMPGGGVHSQRAERVRPEVPQDFWRGILPHFITQRGVYNQMQPSVAAPPAPGGGGKPMPVTLPYQGGGIQPVGAIQAAAPAKQINPGIVPYMPAFLPYS